MNKRITRLLPDGAPGMDLEPMGYISPETVVDGTLDERGHMFFSNPEGTVNAGVWECTACTERIMDYPYDQCCFVLEGSLTITDADGHSETFIPGDAFMIPRGFSGNWAMTERYRNFFVTVEPPRPARGGNR